MRTILYTILQSERNLSKGCHARSERLARSQSEGRRFQEAVIINSSLSALGKVVLNLAARNTKSRQTA